MYEYIDIDKKAKTLDTPCVFNFLSLDNFLHLYLYIPYIYIDVVKNAKVLQCRSFLDSSYMWCVFWGGENAGAGVGVCVCACVRKHVGEKERVCAYVHLTYTLSTPCTVISQRNQNPM